MQRRDVTDLLGRNSRFSYPAIGDLGRADRLRAHRPGRACAAIIDRYGSETIAAARDEIFAQTERFEREAVAAIPDGVYHAEGCLDDDGVSAEPCWVRLSRRGPRRRDDDRPLRDRRRPGRPGQLRRGAGDLRLPRRLQAAHQPATTRRTAAPSGRCTVSVRPGSMLGGAGAGAVPVVLHAARPAHRPRRQGAGRGPAGAGGRRELRRLDGDQPVRHRPPQRPARGSTSSRPSAAGARGRLRRRGRADQQRQRLAQGPADRGAGDEVPDAA